MALRDIATYRDWMVTGGQRHIVSAQGSFIPWQNLQIDWSVYGAGDPSLSDMEVLINMYNDLEM